MISARDFVHSLKEKDLRFFTGVPCSFFQSAINCVIDDPALRYTIVPNEGAALAAAAGAYLAGAPSVVMIQNSGLGNLINPLTSLNMIYHLPVLLLISGRAYGIPDEPQHEIIGKTMGGLLDVLGIGHEDLPEDLPEMRLALDKALERMKQEKKPFAFFVRKDTIAPYEPQCRSNKSYPLKRIDAIRLISAELTGHEYVIATTGMPSRELFSVCDKESNFYMQGSMGHAAAIGLGVALNQPEKKVVVLDGDGALLMHMGILSSVGFYRPVNFYHIVLDNESYETTGDQDTTSSTTDLVTIAKASGYRTAQEAITEEELRSSLKPLLHQDGPVFLRVKINREPTSGIPRITTKYTAQQITENFKKALARR